MVPGEVVRLLDALEAANVRAWLDGGWGVDALLGEQQRAHDDLDLVVELKDVATVEDVLRRAGYTDKDRGAPLSFMVVDSEGRQVDIHPVVFDDDGNGLYQMDNGKTWTYPAEGFRGVGQIGRTQVRCLSPRVQMLVHSGYELSQKDHDEIHVLHDRFGVDPPRGYSSPSGYQLRRRRSLPLARITTRTHALASGVIPEHWPRPSPPSPEWWKLLAWPFTRWLRVGWLIVAADFLYWISGVAYRGEEQQMSDWHATFNTVTYFGGWILVGLLLLGEFIAWAAKPRDL